MGVDKTELKNIFSVHFLVVVVVAVTPHVCSLL